MNNDYERIAKELSNIKPSPHYIKEALRELIKLNKSEWIWWGITIILSLYMSWNICFSYNTVESTDTILNILLGIQLALFGVVFTVFSIILAFFNDNMLKTLARVEIENEPAIKTYLSYYEKILFLYFVNITMTLIGIIIVKLTDNNFILGTKTISDIIAFVISTIYYSFSIKLFLETKSVIYNTIVLFRANLSYKFVGFLQDDDNECSEK